MRWKSVLFLSSFSIKLFSQITIPTGTTGMLLETVDTTMVPHISNVVFERFLSSYQWNVSHSSNIRYNDWFLIFDEKFRSSLIRTDRNFIKDHQELRFLGGRNVNNSFDIRVTGSSLLLSDRQITGLNDATANTFLAGTGYHPLPGINIAPYLGYTIDRQADRTDQGITYLSTLRVNDYETPGEILLNADGQFYLQRIEPRTNAHHYITLNGERYFDGQTFIGFNSYYSYGRREFYIPVDPIKEEIIQDRFNIDQRRDTRSGFSGELQYEFNPQFVSRFISSVDLRTVSRGHRYKPFTTPGQYLFDTAVDEFNFNLRMEFRYHYSDWFSGATHIQYSERSEEHRIVSPPDEIPVSFIEDRSQQEFQKNNITRRTSIITHGAAQLNRRHRISFSGSTSILRYDTPSLRNFDDRDELRILGSIGSRHIINDYITFHLGLDAVLTHVVYLRAQRSANNHWNRVLRLTPTIIYQPADWIKTTQTFEVLANYTVYDFEDLVSNVRSLSYRQIGWVDSTQIRLTEKTGITFFTYIRRFDRGELRWDSFSERPLHSFEEYTILTTIRYDFRPNKIAFAGGIRYFKQNRYRFEGSQRRFEIDLENIGPTCYIYWNINDKFELTLNGWYEIQYRDGERSSIIPNIFIDIGARL